MSTGLFLGVRGSYIDEAQDSAATFLEAINRALDKNGFDSYADPPEPPDVYAAGLFGRSALDHHSSRIFALVASLGGGPKVSPNLALIHDNPYRVAFIPVQFPRPIPSGFSEQIAGRLTEIWLGCLKGLLGELTLLAGTLGVSMNQGVLADEIARAINDFEPLRDGDSVEMVEDKRTAWLALFEGARLALEHNAALTLAG